MLRRRGLSRFFPLLGVALIAATLLFGSATAANTGPVDLGTLGGGSGWANSINNAGAIVGVSENAEGNTSGFLWQKGEMGGLRYPESLGGAAVDINDRGQVVGYALSSDMRTFAWVWERGVYAKIEPLADSDYCFSAAINNAGVAVGACMVSPGEYHAFVWRNGKAVDLFTLNCPMSTPSDINDRGDILGYISGIGPGICTRQGIIPVCFFEDDCGDAKALNNRRQVVGTAHNQPALWDNGKVTALGTLGGGEGKANDINEAGRVVGYATTGTLEEPKPEHAFLWDGQMHDLGTLGGDPANVSSRAEKINNRGDIAGWATDDNYQSRAVWWPAN